MKPTLVVFGHGPGISDAVARRFGREGHPVALVARNAARLAAAVESLRADGITAQAFPCDLTRPDGAREVVKAARAALGPIGVVHYNAYTPGAGDLLTAPHAELEAVLAVGVGSLVAAVQEAASDLRAARGSLLVTGGGLCFYDAAIEQMATQWGAMGLALSKAAQHKAVGLLRAKLAPDGVYVGEVVVTGMVKGTAFDHGNATLEPAAIADRFWQLHTGRGEGSVTFP